MTARPTHQATLRIAGCEHCFTPCARWAVAALALTLVCLSPAWGQVLSDPTRPPQEWLAAQPKGAGTPSAAEQEATPQLQSLLIGPSRRFAIIDGQLVGVGDRFNDARVVAVRPAGVVLRSKRGTQTLRLFPDVEKRPVKPAAADAGRTPAKAKRSIRVGGIGSNVAKENK